MCARGLAGAVGIVGQGTLEALAPHCLGANNKALKYFLNFVAFSGPHSFCPNSPGQLQD